MTPAEQFMANLATPLTPEYLKARATQEAMGDRFLGIVRRPETAIEAHATKLIMEQGLRAIDLRAKCTCKYDPTTDLLKGKCPAHLAIYADERATNRRIDALFKAESERQDPTGLGAATAPRFAETAPAVVEEVESVFSPIPQTQNDSSSDRRWYLPYVEPEPMLGPEPRPHPFVALTFEQNTRWHDISFLPEPPIMTPAVEVPPAYWWDRTKSKNRRVRRVWVPDVLRSEFGKPQVGCIKREFIDPPIELEEPEEAMREASSIDAHVFGTFRSDGCSYDLYENRAGSRE